MISTNVAGVQFVASGTMRPFDFGTHASVSDLSVDGVGEIDGVHHGEETTTFPWGCKGVDLFRVEIHLERRRNSAGSLTSRCHSTT